MWETSEADTQRQQKYEVSSATEALFHKPTPSDAVLSHKQSRTQKYCIYNRYSSNLIHLRAPVSLQLEPNSPTQIHVKTVDNTKIQDCVSKTKTSPHVTPPHRYKLKLCELRPPAGKLTSSTETTWKLQTCRLMWPACHHTTSFKETVSERLLSQVITPKHSWFIVHRSWSTELILLFSDFTSCFQTLS